MPERVEVKINPELIIDDPAQVFNAVLGDGLPILFDTNKIRLVIVPAIFEPVFILPQLFTLQDRDQGGADGDRPV